MHRTCLQLRWTKRHGVCWYLGNATNNETKVLVTLENLIALRDNDTKGHNNFDLTTQ